MAVMQDLSQSISTVDSAPRGGRRACIEVARRQCVEVGRKRQNAGMRGGPGGPGLLRGLWVLRGRSALDRLEFSARPDYPPVRQATGAFRPQVQCCLGFAGHHHGAHADQ